MRTCAHVSTIKYKWVGLRLESAMGKKIINDQYGERDKAGPNDSSEDEKDLRRMVGKGGL